MGVFDFLKSFSKEKEQPKQVANPVSIPTIKAEKALFDSYEIVFKREVANVSGITPNEFTDIYKIISTGDGGFLNMHHYHAQVYEKYFKGRDWAWIEYDKWNNIFTKLGKFPTSFIQKNGSIDVETALGYLSVAELKDLLKSRSVEFTSKDKKPDLINKTCAIADIGSEEIIKSKIAEKLEKEKYGIYTILMRTIHFRGKALFDHNRAKAIGVKKFEIVHTYENDKEFADMALKENPNILPPFYPYDLSYLSPVMDFN